MRNISIIALSILLTACSSGELITNVTSESHQEEYKTKPMVEPMKESTVMESDVGVTAVAQQQVVKAQVSQPKPSTATRSSNKMIKILPPTQKQEANTMRFWLHHTGYGRRQFSESVELCKPVTRGSSSLGASQTGERNRLVCGFIW